MRTRGRRRRPRTSALADAAAGAVAGLAASWAMSLAYKPIWRAGDEETLRREREAQAGMPPATIQAAEAAAGAIGKGLSDDPEKQALVGKLVHYAYGTAWGAVFALAARALGRRAPVATGLAFGAALWAVSDELLVPLLRFSRPPTRYPASTHAKGLASHLVYGVATDAGWRLARAALR